MFDLLERLQQRSEFSRQLIAVGVSLGLTSLIFMFWFAGPRLHSEADSGSYSASVIATRSPERAKGLRGRTAEGWVSLTDQVAKIEQFFENYRINLPDRITDRW